MKYLILFERFIAPSPFRHSDLEVGDYVYCEETGVLGNLRNFLYSNVGQIISKGIYYEIEYENIPKKLKMYFDNNSRRISWFEIVTFSKNKEELEMQHVSKKFNI